MTSTQRINKYIEKYENLSSKELVRIYNESAEECLFNNYNASTKAYAMFKASEYCLAGREDASFSSLLEKYRFWNGENWIDG